MMVKEGFCLKGTITDRTGFPVKGAFVRAFHPRGFAAGEGLTDEKGGFCLDGLEPVSHLLLAAAEGFIPAWWGAIPGEEPVCLGLEPARETAPGVTGVIAAAETGASLAGAAVELRAEGGPPLGRTATTPDGRFSFRGLPPGNYILTAFADGCGHLRRTIALAEGEKPCLLMDLPSGPARLRGLVREAGSGSPLPGALAAVCEEGGEILAAVRTDAGGRFAFAGLAPGAYVVRGWTRDYSPAAAGVTLGPGDEAQCELRLAPASGCLAGRAVRAADRTPLAGAAVRLHDPSGLLLAAMRADDRGCYRLADLAEGPHHLSVQARGHRRAQVGVLPSPGAGAAAGVTLLAGGAGLAGRVAAATGEPVPGARVRIMNQDGLVLDERAVRADGGFDLAGLAAGHYNLVARGPHCAAGWMGAVAVEGLAARVEIRLGEKRGAFATRLLLPGGRPPARAAFTVYTRKGLAVASGLAAADGSLGCDDLPPGEYILLVRCRGLAAEAREFFIAAGETARLELVPAGETAVLTGCIRAGGRPVPGAAVRVLDEKARPLGLALADGEGRYLLSDLPGGRAILVAGGPGLAARAVPVEMAPAGRTTADLELETRPCHILKRVADARGDPMPGAEVQVVEISSGRPLFTLVTNEEGFFRLRAWPAAAAAPPWTWL